MTRGVKQVDILRAAGVDQLALFVLDGLTHAEIALALGVTHSALTSFIYNLDGPDRAVIDAAMRASAEAIYEEAGRILDDAPGEFLSGPGVALLRARASHRRMRAGQRNARFRERGAPAENAAPGTAATGQKLTFHLELAAQGPAEELAHMLDGEAERVE